MNQENPSIRGVSRAVEDEKIIILHFDRKLTDYELRALLVEADHWLPYVDRSKLH